LKKRGWSAFFFVLVFVGFAILCRSLLLDNFTSVHLVH
jgi:hypothetical protein